MSIHQSPGPGQWQSSAEALILAACIRDGVDFPSTVQRLIDNAPDSFTDLRHGKTAAAIRTLQKRGEDINPPSVSAAIGDGFADSLAFIRGLDFETPMALAESEARGLWAAYQVRRQAGIYQEAGRALASAPHSGKSIDANARDAMDTLFRDDCGPDLLESRLFRFDRVPPALQPVYTLAGQCVGTRGNLSTITALVKAGKTAVIEAMIASAMAQPGADCFSFESANPNGRALLHFDSEQSPFDHDASIRRALKRGGLDAPPPWLFSYCLTGLNCRQAWKLVHEAIQRARDLYPGIHSILLDGAADFIADVNDAAECNAFVAELHGLAIEHDCHVVGAIHFNPGTEKSRGHLGSQLERKAETNLRLDKVDGVTVIWSDKQRRAPITKDSGPCFQWSDAAQMHVTVATLRAKADGEKRETLIPQVDDLFREHPSMRYADLMAYFTDKRGLKLKERTAERRIRELSKLKLIVKSVAGLYARGT